MFTQKVSEPLDVAKILSGRKLFITGTSGFVGKALLAKVLSSVDVNRVYLLLRAKANLSVQARLKVILADSIFEPARTRYGSALESKITVVEGSLTASHLGMNPATRAKLCMEMRGAVFLHLAASVRFNEPLNTAMKTNVHGSAQVLQLAKDSCAQGFVHVSTNYVNSREDPNSRVMETFYPISFDPIKAYQTWCENDGFSDVEASFYMNSHEEQQTKWPNTYALTKSICERVLQERCKQYGIPLAIQRIGGVCPDSRTQWFHGQSGPLYFVNAVAYGTIVMLPGTIGRHDLVPVDHCVHGLIAITADLLQNSQSDVAIYHGSINDYVRDPTLLEAPEMFKNLWEFHRKNDDNILPESLVRSARRARFIENELLFSVCFFLCYHLPYYLFVGLNAMLRCFLPKRNALTKKIHLLNKARTQIPKFIGAYRAFFNGSWIFDGTNTKALFQRLTPESQAEFPFDGYSLDFKQYCIDIFTTFIKYEQDKIDARKAEKTILVAA